VIGCREILLRQYTDVEQDRSSSSRPRAWRQRKRRRRGAAGRSLYIFTRPATISSQETLALVGPIKTSRIVTAVPDIEERLAAWFDRYLTR